ncbi:MAG: hypothetical protein RSF42_06400 [Comamonas sp.]
MAMVKTEKARNALRDRGSLSVQERQILILCDGMRSRQEIVGWLGDSAGGLMDSLLVKGYLDVRSAAQASAPGAGVISKVAETSWANASLSPLAIETCPASLLAAPVIDSNGATKRSLAGCKMYAVGILQMQRSNDAQAMAQRLQRTSDEAELLRGLLDMLQFLEQKTNASYTLKVKKHLEQALPQVHLQMLHERLALAALM